MHCPIKENTRKVSGDAVLKAYIVYILTHLYRSSFIRVIAQLYLPASFLCILHLENERLSCSIKYSVAPDISVKLSGMPYLVLTSQMTEPKVRLF